MGLRCSFSSHCTAALAGLFSGRQQYQVVHRPQLSEGPEPPGPDQSLLRSVGSSSAFRGLLQEERCCHTMRWGLQRWDVGAWIIMVASLGQ